MLKDLKLLCPLCGRDFCSDYMDIYSGLCLECTSKLLKEINQYFEEETEIKERLEILSLEEEQKDDYDEATCDDWNDDDYDSEEESDDENGKDYGYGYDMRDEELIEEDENYQNKE